MALDELGIERSIRKIKRKVESTPLLQMLYVELAKFRK